MTNYADSLAEALAGVELEIRRAFEWLDEQQALWKQAIRDCEEEVVRAKAELSQRKFKTWDGREPDCTVQEKCPPVARRRGWNTPRSRSRGCGSGSAGCRR